MGFFVLKVFARDASPARNNTNYINSDFWSHNPNTGDIFDALYSGNTAYTKNMSWTNSCVKANMQFIEITGWVNDSHLIPEIITWNTVYILSGWIYRNTTTNILLSWDCIAIIGRENPLFAGTFNFDNTKYSVIDNMATNSTNLQLQDYTTSLTGELTISTNMYNINYFIDWIYIVDTLTGVLFSNQVIKFWIANNNKTDLHISLYNTYNHINHFTRSITHDDIQPVLTGIINWTSTKIIEWWIYNTWIQVDISDTNLSGISNYGNPLSGASFNFTTQWLYNIRARDKAGNITWINFEIDTTLPVATYTQWYTGQNMVGPAMTLGRTTQENTTRILSQKVYINKVWAPSISWYLEPQAGIILVSFPDFNNGQYTRQIVITDKAGNIFTWTLQTFTFTKTKQIFITSAQWNLEWWRRYINTTTPSILLSWNKDFNYIINSWTNNGTYIGTTKTEIINYGPTASGNQIVNVRYNTVDNESGYLNSAVVYYIDQIIPIVDLTTKWKRQNDLNQIVYNWAGIDTWAGISRYNLLINDIIVSTWLSTQYIKTWLVINWIYKAQVVTYDRAWNAWYSTAETTVIDTTPPSIYGVTNNWVYNTITYPIIMDENNDPINIIITKNWLQVIAWSQINPYFPNIDWWEANYTITATDLAWNSTWVNFKIDTTAPTINLTLPASGAIITNSNSVLFSRVWSDTNMSWYVFNINQTNWWYFATGINTNNQNITLNNLNNWSYDWYVTAIDKAGNTKDSSWYKFTIDVPFTWNISLSWVINLSGTSYTKWTVSLNVYSNRPSKLTITWDIIWDYPWYMYRELLAGNTWINLDLIAWDGQKYIYTRFEDQTRSSTWSISSTYRIIIDNIWPSKPSLSANQTYTWSTAITWSASIDSWAWVKEYNYIIYEWTIIKKQWTTTISSITINNMELWNTGTYTIKVQANDNVNNIGERSDTVSFTYFWIPDVSPDAFYFARQYDASLERAYSSTTITVTGLSLNTSIRADIDEWSLYINWTNVGKRWLVKNWDTVYISLISSQDYDDITTSTLTIWDKASVYKVTTKTDPDDEEYNNDSRNLTDDEIEELEDIYDLIKGSDILIQTKFKDMLEDKIREMEDDWADEDNIDKVRYIYDKLIEDMDNNQDVLFTAPNNKKYTISYESGRWYTSINFISSGKYFFSLDEIKTYINKNNPVNNVSYTRDYSRTSSTYTAPNGKKYYLIKTTTGKYTATNFVIPKLFDTLALVKSHINKNNPR